MTAQKESGQLLVEPTIMSTPAIIKVIGVGGGGGNAVGQMYREGIEGVRFLVTNTDSKALEDSVVPDKLQLGAGLGAGGRPELGKLYAEESLGQIEQIFDESTKMLFLTAGMGGGTGTGASPVIARAARKHGVLTVGVVTIPFLFERTKQIDKALDGLEKLRSEVDALLVINNERLRDIYSDFNILQAFKMADDTLTKAVRSIVEIITMHGKVGLDFRDVHNVLKDGGEAVMSYGFGEGDGRVTKAIKAALYSPLVKKNDIYNARKIILSITTSSEAEHTLRMEEIGEINDFMARFSDEVETKWGLVTDKAMEDRVKITLLATGFKPKGGFGASLAENDEAEAEHRAKRRTAYYGDDIAAESGWSAKRRPHVFIFEPDDLDNEAIAESVDALPTAKRSADQLKRLRQQTTPSPATEQGGEAASHEAAGKGHEAETAVIDFT